MVLTSASRLALASAEVAAVSARTAKRDALVAVLAELDRSEIRPAVALLTGEARQGRIGVGWATVAAAYEAASASAENHSEGAAAGVSIHDLDAELTALAELSGPGSGGMRAERLSALASSLDSQTWAWLGQVLTGGLRQGALRGVMAEAVAKVAGVPAAAVRRAAMLGGDWPMVAEVAIVEGRAGLASVSLTVGRGVLPMLAASAQTAAEAVAEMGPSSVEWKLDGIRLQAHKAGDVINLYSRNLNDLTERLPGVSAIVGSLEADQVVLDGEIMGFGAEGRPAAFAESMADVAREAGPLGDIRPFFFDLVHLNGRDLIDEPLSSRLELLTDLVPEEYRVPRVATDEGREADEVMAAALKAGHEGVVVKQLTSTYQAGRRGKAWRKVKPVHTFDLVVLAAEWGHGRRTGWLSNLWLGARKPEHTGHLGPDDFFMVGKTFKGLTDQLLEWQTAEFLAREVERSGHVVHVRPELVVEIALDGVQRSTRYPGGIALRFARVRHYRTDKRPDETDTIEALRSLGGL